jgi:hypothetical protein
MKDCRTFLRLQGALDSNQVTHQGGRNTSQGYQMQHLARHLESKVYISAMIQPVPKFKKEQKSISRQVNLAISSPPATTEYLRRSDQIVRFSRVDHPRKVPKESAQAKARQIRNIPDLQIIVWMPLECCCLAPLVR